MDEKTKKLRLDSALVERGYFSTRSRARDAVLRSTVSIAGVVIKKPGQLIDLDTKITVQDPAQDYVSRAALKLIAALDLFKLDVTNAKAADIGASTGGFTQVLLERGAQYVTAIDVGQGQLATQLRHDSRVKVYEKLNARALTKAHFTTNDIFDAPDLIVSDVSFISLKLALPPALALAKQGARTVLLVKPQFEVGKENIGRGGLVKDSVQTEDIAQDLYQWLDSLPGWHARGIAPSPIAGGEGAQEFLLFGEKD